MTNYYVLLCQTRVAVFAEIEPVALRQFDRFANKHTTVNNRPHNASYT